MSVELPQVASKEMPSEWLKKNKEGKWESTDSAAALATTLEAKYEALAKSTGKTLDALKTDILHNIAGRDAFNVMDAKGNQLELVVQNDQQGRLGLLEILRTNCGVLDAAFKAVPGINLFAYWHIYKTLKGQGKDANYLPEGTKITMTDGVVTLNYPDGTMAVSDLFAWADNVPVVSAASWWTTEPDVTPEPASKAETTNAPVYAGQTAPSQPLPAPDAATEARLDAAERERKMYIDRMAEVVKSTFEKTLTEQYKSQGMPEGYTVTVERGSATMTWEGDKQSWAFALGTQILNQEGKSILVYGDQNQVLNKILNAEIKPEYDDTGEVIAGSVEASLKAKAAEEAVKYATVYHRFSAFGTVASAQ